MTIQQRIPANQQPLEYFQKNIPTRPYCSDQLDRGIWREAKPAALQLPYIQANPNKLKWCIILDVDRASGSHDWQDRLLPPPNIVTVNPKNGHAHLVYFLSDPVPTSDLARIKPMKLLTAVSEGLRKAADADRGYSQLITKTPGHDRWNTAYWHCDLYSLEELADYVSLPTQKEMKARIKEADYSGLGRNCELFERLRRWAYREVKFHWKPNGSDGFHTAVRLKADEFNDYHNQLPSNEVKAIAKSVSKWVWQRFTPSGFRKVQSERGKLKGKARRDLNLDKVLKLRADGLSNRQIALQLDVNRQTVANWIEDALNAPQTL
jgi:hypothetical protein